MGGLAKLIIWFALIYQGTLFDFLLIKYMVVTCIFQLLASAQDCASVTLPERVDCGQVGTQQAECEAGGCCWDPVKAGEPWCFYPAQSRFNL